jgi:type II secretory pathway pseudopilin PulG
MKLPLSPRQRTTARMAFTLVELLVVIAIIIVLASLLLAAVFKALDTAYQAQTRTDITQLTAAVQSFQTKFQLSSAPPPSRLVLCKQWVNYYSAPGVFKSQLHQDSLEYLQRVWPRLDWSTPHPRPDSQKWTGMPVWQGIDWDNSDAANDIGTSALVIRDSANNAVASTEVLLEGEQTIVFFLGGIANSGAFTGFSTDASNPARHTLAYPNPGTNNTDDRIPPFFEFKSDRLVFFSQWLASQGFNPQGYSDFYAYKDGYGKTPFAYFSSYKTANGYNRYFGLLGTSDCNGLGVWPYAQSLGLTPGSTPIYYNAQSFQIISAGKDLVFGPGSNPSLPAYGTAPVGPYNTWAPAYASQAYPQGSFGYDDIANFYDRLLGVPTQ